MRCDVFDRVSTWKPLGDYRKAVAAALLLLFAFQGAQAVRTMSCTADETHYLAMGSYLLKTRNWDLDDALLHPPLSYYLHSLALLAEPIDYRTFQIRDMNERGRVLMDSAPDDHLLHLARLPVLMLATLLGFLVLAWGWQACGPAAGLGALFLYVFNPTILSNAALITPDLCLTLFSTLTFYLLWRYLRRPGWMLLLATGGALGLTLLSKYSGILVVIALLLISALQRFRRHNLTGILGFRQLAIVLLLALLVVDAGYFFCDTFHFLDGAGFRSHLFQSLAHTGLFHVIPLPLPRAYVMGIDWQYTIAENGFGYFMFGKVAQHGWIFYYLVAFLLKSPVPFVVLTAMSLVVRVRDDDSRTLRLVLLVPAAIFLMYFSLASVSRGLRYLLPIFPLLFVWIVPVTLRRCRKSRFLRVAAVALALWYAWGSLRIAPHYLAYFNELCGGPNNGYKLLHESEFDWGQGLKELREYLDARGIKHVQLGYFGTADPAHYGIHYDPLPCDRTWAWRKEEPIAVSATALYWDCNRWLLQLEPSDKVGYTIFIYNVPRTH